ncbi:hypothetical protein HOH45_05320, partial [bacterium]|nr:hypothetical protein [bacterium]
YGTVYENWRQDKDKSQKASEMTNKYGTVFENWEQDKDGSQKASKITDQDGNVKFEVN